jgi:DNA modification methylase
LDSIVYPGGEGYPNDEAGDQLIWGDNLGIMSALLPELEGRVKLIYTDPPFFTNRRYPARVGRGEDSRHPKEWKLTEGYPDHWPDLDSYLDMLYPRLVLMHRLLAPNGSLYLHLDWHANAYARLLLDEIFGPDRLLNEIVWVYHGPSPIRKAFNRKHDTILVYTKGEEYTFNVDAVRTPYDPSTVKTFASSPKAGFGKVPDLKRGKVPEDWWYYPVVARLHNERTGYPTQKPEALVERIVQAASNPGDLVADFFCGSGTLGEVARRLDRRILLADANWRAVHTAYSRLGDTGRASFRMFTAQLDNEGSFVEAGRTGPASGFTAERQGQELVVSASDSLAAGLDYWELDPGWNGEFLRSAAQAHRPLRRGRIAQELRVPSEWASDTIYVRFVQIDGKRGSSILPLA